MNEQLIVKNFGPIKNATVDFKRVTVFIGPTGGGKSTLAKLAAVFREHKDIGNTLEHNKAFNDYSILDFTQENTSLEWLLNNNEGAQPPMTPPDSSDNEAILNIPYSPSKGNFDDLRDILLKNNYTINDWEGVKQAVLETLKMQQRGNIPTTYITSNRTFIPAIEYSWAGLLRDDIGLPKDTLDFANGFFVCRREVIELEIPFLKVKYLHRSGQDFIKVPGVETLFRLYEAASGIQSVTPLLVLLEHLSRNTEQAQSFIIEEPELNLYPTAQQGLLNWLVEKCTQGENDLTITTHSPYILSHLNLLLYAHHVGNKDEEKRRKVAAIIPEKYWVNPDEFAAYYVNGPEGAGGVRSLLDPETKLISQNELDAVSGIQADEFDQLLDINSGF